MYNQQFSPTNNNMPPLTNVPSANIPPIQTSLPPQSPQTPYPNQPNSNPFKKPKSILSIITYVALFLIVLSLILSIYSVIKISIIDSQLHADVEDEGEVDLALIEDQTIICKLPTNAQDITYIYAYSDRGDSSFFVKSDGYISTYRNATNENGTITSTDKNTTTDTTDIIEQVLNNGINDFHDMASTIEKEGEDESDNTIEYDWYASIDTVDSSSCEAEGNGTPPEWFATLEKQVFEKTGQ